METLLPHVRQYHNKWVNHPRVSDVLTMLGGRIGSVIFAVASKKTLDETVMSPLS